MSQKAIIHLGNKFRHIGLDMLTKVAKVINNLSTAILFLLISNNLATFTLR